MTTAARDEQRALARPRIWRVTDRATFRELRRRGRRARSGPVAVTWLAPDPSEMPTPPRVAFATGRAVGASVRRNRVRRRLRAALRELQGQGRLPGGSYLLAGSAEVARMPWPDLVAAVGEAVDAATAVAA